jgi:hypothetical protein
VAKLDASTWLRPGEERRADWPAAVPTHGGRGARRGGRLHLTTQRLVWLPLEVDVVLVAGDTAIPARAGGGPHWEIELSSVAAVRVDADRPAILVISASDGSATRYLVQANRRTPLWSRKNHVACSEAVAVIEQARQGRPASP